MHWTPIALLLGALALFLISTVQLRWWIRIPILLAAAALWFCAALLVSRVDQSGLIAAFRDLATNWRDFRNSLLGVAVSNEPVVDRHVLPLIDLFLIVAAAIGVLSAVALTPGEKIERATRSLIGSLVSTGAGAALALSLVALGLGGAVKQRAYLGVISSVDDVHDGDTLRLGDVSLRLVGIDAPELNQTCLSGERCGDHARHVLLDLVRDQLIECTTLQTDPQKPPKESFGRPLARCTIRTGERRGDVAQLMRQSGFVLGHEHDRDIAAPAGTYLASQCLLSPHVWRTEPERRHSFEPRSPDWFGACA